MKRHILWITALILLACNAFMIYTHHFQELLIAGCIIFVGCSLGDLTFKILKQNSLIKGIPYIFLFILIVISSMALFVISGRTINEISEIRAKDLINKIEAFKSDNGKYPKKLNELVPDYIMEIPKTGDGLDFIYYDSIRPPFTIALQDVYTLKYRGTGVVVTYESYTKHWSYDD